MADITLEGPMVSSAVAVRMQALTGERLIAEARAYSQDAWGQIYDMHYVQIYRYCYLRLGNRALSEDLASEVFLEALRGIRKYEYRGLPFRAWLFRIAHNLLADHARRNARQHTVPLDDSHADRLETPDSTEGAALREDVREALRQLPEAQKQVILLRFFQDLPHDEIAAIMGKRSGAVRALQHRALNGLHRLMTSQRRS